MAGTQPKAEMPPYHHSRRAGLRKRQQSFKSPAEEHVSKASRQDQQGRATEPDRPLSSVATLLDADTEDNPTRPAPCDPPKGQTNDIPAISQIAPGRPASDPIASGSVAGVAEGQSSTPNEAQTVAAPPDLPLLPSSLAISSGPSQRKAHSPPRRISDPGTVVAQLAPAVELSESAPALTDEEHSDESLPAQGSSQSLALVNHPHAAPVPANSGPVTSAVPPPPNPLKRPQWSSDVQFTPSPPPKRFMCDSRSCFRYRSGPNMQLVPPKPDYKYPPRSYFEWSRPSERDYVENFDTPMFFKSEDYYRMFVKLEYMYLSQFRDWHRGVVNTLQTWTGGLSDTEKQNFLATIDELEHHLRWAVDQLPVSSYNDWANRTIPKIKIEALKRYHELTDVIFQLIIKEENFRGLRLGEPSNDPLELKDIMDRCRGHISVEAMVLSKELLRPELSEYLPFWRPLIELHLNKTVEELAMRLDDMNKPTEIAARGDRSEIDTPDISLTEGLEQLAGLQEPEANVNQSSPLFDNQEHSPEITSVESVAEGMETRTSDENDQGDEKESSEPSWIIFPLFTECGGWDENWESFWDSGRQSHDAVSF